MAIAAFTGNILVIILNHRKKNNDKVKTTGLVFNNLAISDFLMSIYLFIIAIGDINYRNRYALFAEEWLRSPACAIASFLMCTSSLMSVIMMLLISIDRYLVTSDPVASLSSSDTRYKWIKIVLILGWLITCTFVGIPIAMSIEQTGDLRLYKFSSICSPSNIENYFFASWITLFVVIQLIFWIITAVFYIKLLKTVSKSRRSIRSSAQSQNFTIAIRFSFILITDLIAWLPVYVLFAIALTDGELNIFVLQFAIILAIPLNSAINPYIYTATGTACFNRLITFINIGIISSPQSSTTSRDIKVHHSTSKDQLLSTKVAKLSSDGLKDKKETNNKELEIACSNHQQNKSSNVSTADNANIQMLTNYQRTNFTNENLEIDEGNDIVSNCENNSAGNQTAIASKEVDISKSPMSGDNIQMLTSYQETNFTDDKSEINEDNDIASNCENNSAGNQTAIAAKEVDISKSARSGNNILNPIDGSDSDCLKMKDIVIVDEIGIVNPMLEACEGENDT